MSEITDRDTLLACQRDGTLPDDGECPKHGGDSCLVEFTDTGYEFGMNIYRAWFLSAPGLPERQVGRDDYCQAERAAGFIPKPGCGPEATGSFGTSGLSGRCVETWPGRGQRN